MIPVLSCEQSYSLDKITIDSGYLSEKQLMDNAGRLLAQFIIEYIPDVFNQQFIILSGPGNNGGDGIICHHYLLDYGANSQLLLLDDSMLEYWIFKEYSILGDSVNLYSKASTFSPEYWYIDGMFGIGLQGDVRGHYKTIIQNISKYPHVISIDIPTGIYGNTGMATGNSINAECTLSFGFAKWGHYFNEGLVNTGDLFILDIGFKPIKKTKNHIELIELSDIISCVPKHRENMHKYTRGKVITVAGSSLYTGACILAVKAAMSSGSGIVKVLVPESLRNLYDVCLTEAIMVPLVDQQFGTFLIEHVEEMLNEIEWADVVLFGPGIQADSLAVEWMVEVIKLINKPFILDASGFKPLIVNKMMIDNLPQKTILTPHYAEFSQIFNIDLKKIQENPIGAVKSIISHLKGRVLILKGPTNIIVNTEGKVYLMNHGTAALATAGSGDVLTGILASVIAQGLDINEAAIYSSYLHAECAHQYYKHISNKGLIASDLIEMLSYAQEEIHYVS